MKEAKEQWIEAVINSMEGADRAKAPNGLFSKISAEAISQIQSSIPIRKLRWIAAAAAVLLVLNVFAIRQFKGIQSEEILSDDSRSALVSDLKIYE